jgi:hypothetical protein
MTTNSYMTLAELKADLGITDTTDDTLLKAVMEAASRAVDDHCHRRFFVESRTRYYTPRYHDLLDVDDLLSVTTLKHDADGDRTYEETWAATDYDLTPFNAPFEKKPYTAIETTPAGTKVFPTVSRGVEIAGSWGYWSELASLDTLAAAITLTTATTLTATNGTLWSPGMTVLIGSEQMHVQSVSTNTITVTRGVNGTPAATALLSAAVQVYSYPAVNVATRLIARRLFKRRDTPLGVMGSPELGYVRVSAKEDADASALLSPLVKHWVGSVG